MNLLHGKAMILTLVVVGSFLGVMAAGVPSAHASNIVYFYSNPSRATITVDGVEVTYGWVAVYASGQTVHVTATPPPGGRLWDFDRWVGVGVSIDSPLSMDTHITVQEGFGTVTAIFTPIGPDHEHFTPPPPEPSRNTNTRPQVSAAAETTATTEDEL